MPPDRTTDDRTTAAAAVIADEGEPPDDRAFLAVTYGLGAAARGMVVPLPDGVAVTIGRLADNTLTIEHEQVSRHHASVTRRGADITVRDLDSRNGTRVNGVSIEAPTRVAPGDEIAIGPVTAVVGLTTGLRQRPVVGSLSGLEGRLDAELDRAARYRRPLGLIMLRIDPWSEAAIAEISRRLRRMDHLAQYGPGEYAIILPEADRGATRATAHRLVSDVATPGRIYVGLAVCPADATRAGELLSRARAALRLARAGGGDHGVAAAPAEPAPSSSSVVVVDPLMKRVMTMIGKVADTPITVLVLGETGVGKEIIASAIHEQSPRAAKPFQALNCSALAETLLESQLFGHERGAFTGADRRAIGYFEAAAGGTIFLDEVGEIPLGVQAKLLRVLEQRTITRVGGTESLPIDVRVVCATNRNLEIEVERGRFRQDLFFRISAFTVVVPPLRDRRSEILPLAHHFGRHFATELGGPMPAFTERAEAALERHDWPGNVRELRNAIERAVVLAPTGAIDVDHLPQRVARAGQTTANSGDSTRGGQVERDEVAAALEACDGNQTRAAKRLGLSRFALIRLMQKYELKKP